MTSMSSVSPVNRDRLSFTQRSISGGGVESSTASIGRRTSATAVSPFKSPSLSSSPIQSGGNEYPISQSKYYSSPTGNTSGSTRNFSYQSNNPGDDSNSSRKVEFSSSFDRYKGSPSRGDLGTGMSRRLSRNSDHSLVELVSRRETEETLLDAFCVILMTLSHCSTRQVKIQTRLWKSLCNLFNPNKNSRCFRAEEAQLLLLIMNRPTMIQ